MQPREGALELRLAYKASIKHFEWLIETNSEVKERSKTCQNHRKKM